MKNCFDGVILSEAKNLLGISDVESKSGFFSPPHPGGLQNDAHNDGEQARAPGMRRIIQRLLQNR